MAMFSPMVTSYGAGLETAANAAADANRNILTRQAQAMMAAAEAARWRKQLAAQEREAAQRYGFQREELQARLNESAQDRAARLEEAAASREQARALAEGGWAHAERLDERRGLREDTRDERQQSLQRELAQGGWKNAADLAAGAQAAQQRMQEASQKHAELMAQVKEAADAGRHVEAMQLQRDAQAQQAKYQQAQLELLRTDPNRRLGEQKANFLEQALAGGTSGQEAPGSLAQAPSPLPGLDVAQAGPPTATDAGAGGGLAASLQRTRPGPAVAGGLASVFQGMTPEEKKQMAAGILDIKLPKTERDLMAEGDQAAIGDLYGILAKQGATPEQANSWVDALQARLRQNRGKPGTPAELSGQDKLAAALQARKQFDEEQKGEDWKKAQMWEVVDQIAKEDPEYQSALGRSLSGAQNRYLFQRAPINVPEWREKARAIATRKLAERLKNPQLAAEIIEAYYPKAGGESAIPFWPFGQQNVMPSGVLASGR